MFIGLRERGSEGIACPKGGLSPLSGCPNNVHRPIGRFVVSGRRRGWSLPLGRLLIPSSRACLSPFRRAVRFARSHSTAFRPRPAVGYPEQRSREAFASVGSPPLSPSAVCSLRVIKKEAAHQREQLCGLPVSGGFHLAVMSFRVSLFLDTVLQIYNKFLILPNAIFAFSGNWGGRSF